MIKAVVFDLDGTLTNTLGDIANSMNYALRLHGLPEHETQAYCRMIGDGVHKLVERAVAGRDDLHDAVYQTYQAYYSQHAMDTTAPFDGVLDMLAALQERGLKLAVFSNKPHPDTVKVVAHCLAGVKFDAVRGAMPDVPVKPDPAGAFAVAEALGVKPEEFLYLGDMRPDMVCAKNAGMHSVGVTWGFGTAESLREANAEYVIDHPMELIGIL